MTDQSQYLTMPKMVKALSLSRVTIRKMIREGMPAIKLPSGKFLFEQREVDNWLKQVNQLRRPDERET